MRSVSIFHSSRVMSFFLSCFYFLIIIYLLSPIPFTAHSHFMPSNCPLLFLLNFVVIYFLFIFFFIYSNFQREPMFFGKITTHSMEVKRHCKRSYIRQQQLYPLTSWSYIPIVFITSFLQIITPWLHVSTFLTRKNSPWHEPFT